MTNYENFTEKDIQRIREQTAEWDYFPKNIGLDALDKIVELRALLADACAAVHISKCPDLWNGKDHNDLCARLAAAAAGKPTPINCESCSMLCAPESMIQINAHGKSHFFCDQHEVSVGEDGKVIVKPDRAICDCGVPGCNRLYDHRKGGSNFCS